MVADEPHGQPQAPPTREGEDAGGAARPVEPSAKHDESVDHPTRLLRIAAMSRSLLEEVRHDSLDEAARERLAEIHNTSVSALREVVSEELREELDEVGLPVDVKEGAPSESELRMAQAQLVGWLEGLFHGIQASLATQQRAAQEQLQQMKERSLGPGQGGPPGGGRSKPGQYL